MTDVNTGAKDAKGRTVYRGPRGGLYVLSASGNKVAPAKGRVGARAPKPAAKASAAKAVAKPTGTKNAKGRAIWRGPRGGEFVYGPSGKKTRPAMAKGKSSPTSRAAKSPRPTSRAAKSPRPTSRAAKSPPAANDASKELRSLLSDLRRLTKKQALDRQTIQHAKQRGWTHETIYDAQSLSKTFTRFEIEILFELDAGKNPNSIFELTVFFKNPGSFTSSSASFSGWPLKAWQVHARFPQEYLHSISAALAPTKSSRA